jgi:hypothetical protein
MASSLLLLPPKMGLGPAPTCHRHPLPDPCPLLTATVCQSRCCHCPINRHHPLPSWLLLHCPLPATCAKTLPLCHCHSDLLLTLPAFIALSTASGQHRNRSLGGSPPLQPLPPLRSHCCHCRDLLHTLHLLSFHCLLLAQLPPTATAAAQLTTATHHRCRTAVATSVGLLLPLTLDCRPINCHCLHLRHYCCCRRAIDRRHKSPAIAAFAT